MDEEVDALRSGSDEDADSEAEDDLHDEHHDGNYNGCGYRTSRRCNHAPAMQSHTGSLVEHPSTNAKDLGLRFLRRIPERAR